MTVQQLLQYLPIILIVGISVLAPLLRKAAEMREQREQEQARKEREDQAIRMGRPVPREESTSQDATASASQSTPRPSRGSIADELAKRRQQALEQLRQRQQSRTQARPGAAAPGSRPAPAPSGTTAPPPRRGPAAPAPPSGGRRRIQAQQPPRRSQAVETPEIQAARPEVAAARESTPKREGRGLNVRLDSVDQHYVRAEKGMGIDPLRLDAKSIRQALVMSELLGPPIALRDPDNTTMNGPLSLNV